MSKLIFGCGYLGRRVALRWIEAGHQVCAITHRPKQADQLESDGIRATVADVLKPETLTELPAAETVLWAVSFEQSAHQQQVDSLRHVLDALPESTGRFIYISSTGVYGQDDGSWVDEESTCEPVRDAGKQRLAAEKLLQAHPLGQRAIILRLAGIYGPGRIPLAKYLTAGDPIPAPEAGYLNLIHVEDAAGVVLSAEERAQPPRTYVVTDSHPCKRREYYKELAQLLNAPEPQFTEPAADAPVADRAITNKRVKNARMIKELGVTLRYPSYQEGLAAIVEQQS